jgi:hypothetical protein
LMAIGVMLLAVNTVVVPIAAYSAMAERSNRPPRAAPSAVSGAAS